MPINKILKLLTPLLGVFLLTGCFDVKQDIWINPDGSGRLRFDIGLSKQLAFLGEEGASSADELAESLKELGRELVGDPRLHSSPIVEEYSDDDFDRAAIELFVKDWHDLPALNRLIVEQPSRDEAEGDESNRLFIFSLEENEEGNIYYRQPARGSIGEAGPEETKQEEAEKRENEEGFFEGMGRVFAGAFLDEGGLTVTLHSPTISRTNGTLLRDKTGVQWLVELEDLIGNKVEVDAFTAEIGASAESFYFWRVMGVLLMITVLVGLLIWFRRGRQQQPPADVPVT